MKLLRVICTLVTCLVAAGCTTGGLVIGPCSYMASVSNARSMAARALRTADLEPQKKAELFKVMAVGGDAHEYAVSLGVDLLSLSGGQYTIKEAGKSLLGAVGDAAIYGGLAWGAGQIHNNTSDAHKGNIIVYGNVSESQIQLVTGSTAATTGTQIKPYASYNSGESVNK